jgi:hypothetical protein
LEAALVVPLKRQAGELATMTPQEAIRKFCVQCVGSVYEVKWCGGEICIGNQGDRNGVCYLYPYRHGRGAGKPSVKLIRKFCLECMAGKKKSVAECPAVDCTLHRFRFGKNPNFSEKTRQKRREMALKRGLGR